MLHPKVDEERGLNCDSCSFIAWPNFCTISRPQFFICAISDLGFWFPKSFPAAAFQDFPRTFPVSACWLGWNADSNQGCSYPERADESNGNGGTTPADNNHAHMCMYTHAYVHTPVHTYINTHVHMHKYTCTYLHTHVMLLVTVALNLLSPGRLFDLPFPYYDLYRGKHPCTLLRPLTGTKLLKHLTCSHDPKVTPSPGSYALPHFLN